MGLFWRVEVDANLQHDYTIMEYGVSGLVVLMRMGRCVLVRRWLGGHRHIVKVGVLDPERPVACSVMIPGR